MQHHLREGKCMHGFDMIVKEGDHLEKLGIAGRIIIKIDFKIWDGRVWTGFIWFRTVISGSRGDHRNETSGSIKFGGNMMLDLDEPGVGLVDMAKKRFPSSSWNRIAVSINERHGIQFQQLKLVLNKPRTSSYTRRYTASPCRRSCYHNQPLK
jgi:hypothetical protein